jgi:hypothetical protein
MNELIERLLASGLKDLSGLEVTGSVPIRQELLNEAIAKSLQALMPSAPAATEESVPAAPPETAPARRPRLDPKALLPYVRRAEVTAADGTLTLHFTVRID